MFQLFNPDWQLPIIRLSRITVVVSTVLMVLSAFALFKPGLDFALDFTGGTVVELRFEEAADLDRIRTTLNEAGYAGAQIQSFGSTREVLIRLRPDHEEIGREAEDEAAPGASQQPQALRLNAGERVHRLLADTGMPAEMRRNESVGPQIGQELAEDGIVAMVFVMAGIMLYVALRYEWRFGLAALAGQFHDVLLTAGFLAITQQSFDLQALAALLTVAGYSINDKIVIFDRIREIFRTSSKRTPAQTIDYACSDTLSRTVITGITTIMGLSVLYFFGGEALKVFSLTLIIGVIIGTYSSLLYSSPLLLKLGVTKQDLMPKMRDETELARRP